MKIIRLADITFYILNLKEDTERRKFMENQLKDLGLKYIFISAVKAKPGFVGISLSHLKVLKSVTKSEPFAVLEDDTQFFNERIKKELKVPDGTDGIYLGHSTFGLKITDRYGLQWGKKNGAKYEVYDEDFLKIKSMLARHAIIYVSQKFKENAIKANLKALLHKQFPFPGDMAYAQIQKDHLLLAPHYPWCYQSEKHRGNHPATKHSILEKLPLE